MRNKWTPFLSMLAAAGLSLVDAGPLVASGLSSLPPVADPGPCVPPSNASTPAGLRGYARFHANVSLIGRPVPCTRDHKTCFRHNLIFDAGLDRCEPIGGGSPACDLRPNRTEFENGSGHIIGVCKTYEDPCPGYRMAYDGRCYRKEVVRDIICGCNAKPTRHILEGVECSSSSPTPINVEQPKEDGRCLLPDLRFPDTERAVFFENSLTVIQGFRGFRMGISFREAIPRLKCESEQAACFSQEKVLVSGFQGCYSLLKKGPCPDEHVVAVDSQAAKQGRAEAMCVHVRGGCPRGYKRMVFDGQCHEDRELTLEAPGRVVWNQYGQYVLISHSASVWFHPKKLAADACEVRVSAASSQSVQRLPNPSCDENHNDQCQLYEVEVEAPKPLAD